MKHYFVTRYPERLFRSPGLLSFHQNVIRIESGERKNRNLCLGQYAGDPRQYANLTEFQWPFNLEAGPARIGLVALDLDRIRQH